MTELKKVYFFFFSLLALSFLLKPFYLFFFKEDLRSYYLSYETLDSKKIAFSSPLFKQINDELFPGYDIEKFIQQNALVLREKNQFSFPTVLLADGRVITIKVPIALISSLLVQDPPDIAILGSSTCREALRPSALAEEFAGKKILNLCLSRATPEIVLDFLSRFESQLKKKIELIFLVLDDYSLSRAAEFRGEIDRARKKYSENLRSADGFDLEHFPAFNFILEDMSKESAEPKPWPSEKEFKQDPRQFFLKLPYHPDSRFKSAEIGRAELGALKRLLALSKSLSSRTFVLSLPMMNEIEQRFASGSQAPLFADLSSQAGFFYHAFSNKELGLVDADYFFAKEQKTFDIFHLNPRAGVRVSKQIARFARDRLSIGTQ